jgi:hypothetical protein
MAFDFQTILSRNKMVKYKMAATAIQFFVGFASLSTKNLISSSKLVQKSNGSGI